METRKTMEKTSETESWYFEEKKITKLLVRLSKGKKTKKKKIRNVRGDITLDTIEVQRIPKNYCEQLYANKLDYLEKWKNF